MKGINIFKRRHSLRVSILGFFLLAVAICFSVGLYNYLSLRDSLQELSTLMGKSRQLSGITTNIQTIQGDMDLYLRTRNSETLSSYYNSRNSVQQDARSLTATEYTLQGVKLKNLGGMLNHYLETLEKTIVAKRNERTAEYMQGYQDSVKEYIYIADYIQHILNSDLMESASQYERMQKEIDMRTTFSYILFVITLISIIILIILFSNQITAPLIKLAGYAAQVSEGDYTVEVEGEAGNIEMAQLYETLAVMIQSTKLYVDSIEEKRQLEQQLSQVHIKGLEMTNALREAEYLALHSQMNPHFIFNTINIGAKIAMMQGDDIVCNYLENAADVFRYNLSGLKQATLGEELENVNTYMTLLTTRFGDKLRYQSHIPQDKLVETFTLPRMTLQPLVENAYVHGVSKNEDGGDIRLEVRLLDDCLQIIICNNGPAFASHKVEEILNGLNVFNERPLHSEGHISGIGLPNVLKRLYLFFNTDHLIDIKREAHETKVILTLPLYFNSKRGD